MCTVVQYEGHRWIGKSARHVRMLLLLLLLLLCLSKHNPAIPRMTNIKRIIISSNMDELLHLHENWETNC